jgi:NAD kinase
VNYEKIILVTRKTRLEGLVERFNTVGQAKFYLEHSGGNFMQYQQEYDTYHAAVDRLRVDLQELAKFQEIERGFLPNFLFADSDIVVTVGIDGLVVNTAKYLNGQPLVAVNPDPVHIDGILLPFNVEQAALVVQSVLKDQARARLISMAEVQLNDGQSLLAFNDLFIGVKSHISARYLIQQGKQQERHSSSGIIVSTGAGSTGWLSSLFNMANGMMTGFEKDAKIARKLPSFHLGWEEEKLFYVVREPFASKTSGAKMVCGYVTPNEPLLLQSEMPEGGVIFSDGVEADFLAFNAGANATIGLSKKKTKLIVGSQAGK